MNKAVFLDRDGTINIEKKYLYKIEDFEFIDGAQNAIKLLNDSGYKVIVITNQAGIARGYYNEGDVENLHLYISEELRKYGAHIDAFYYCPHHPSEGKGIYKINCDCRKPKSGLYRRAIEEFNISAQESYVVGDKVSDLIPGIALNMKAILLETGYGKEEKNNIGTYDILIKSKIDEAISFIVKK